MITKEVNDWIRKVERGNYPPDYILEEFSHIMRYLTREEAMMIKNRLLNQTRHNSL